MLKRSVSTGLGLSLLLAVAGAAHRAAAAPAVPEATPPYKDPKVREAEAKAREATARAEAAAAKQRELQQQVDQARTGKLIRFGLTAGFALVGHSRSNVGTDGVQQRSFEVGTMPYFAVVPAYWSLSDIEATYCASRFSEADHAAALSVALAAARERAKAQLPDCVRADLESQDEAKRRAAEARLAAKARSIWTPEDESRCWPTLLALYVGMPLKYDADVRPPWRASEGYGEAERRSVEPTISFGAALIPNTHISLLFGVTHARISLPQESGGPRQTKRFGTYTFGVGGNIDLLGSLLRP